MNSDDDKMKQVVGESNYNAQRAFADKASWAKGFAEEASIALKRVQDQLDFLRVWMPVGIGVDGDKPHFVKRFRYTTRPHQLRKMQRRRQGKAARHARRLNRRTA